MFFSVALLAALTSPSQVMLNPQPLPPLWDTLLADGKTKTVVSPDGLHIFAIRNGKRVALPPGPCRLISGKTITIGTDGKILDDHELNIGSQSSGAGAGK